jgi:hypothetical protein
MASEAGKPELSQYIINIHSCAKENKGFKRIDVHILNRKAR